MTDANHLCEIISDMYALSKRRKDFTKDNYEIPVYYNIKSAIDVANDGTAGNYYVLFK